MIEHGTVSKRPVVVVPDGLKADRATGRVLGEVSFVYRAVLDHVIEHYAGHEVLLAPANDFGSGYFEQAVAARYLEGKVARLVVPEGRRRGYIDTRGNARDLRTWLEQNKRWPQGEVVLVAAFRHAKRARLCFRREGFEVAQTDAVTYQCVAGEEVVRRLWYYRHPCVHAGYETLAWVRDWLRPATALGLSQESR